MTHNTKIEWTHIPGYKRETWNPIVGCSVASPGCKNCYAMPLARKMGGNPATPHYAGTTMRQNGKTVWTGVIRKASEKTLLAPLHWKSPRAIFVNSMGDVFHENTPDDWIDRVFAIMALCPQHIFIVLTKRAERMREYIAGLGDTDFTLEQRLERGDPLSDMLQYVHRRSTRSNRDNIWLGVTAEDQKRAEERIHELLHTQAAVRFVSFEPLLGEVDLNYMSFLQELEPTDFGQDTRPRLDGIICSGETGPGARPMHPDWARSLRDQCKAAGAPFFFKHHGEWGEAELKPDRKTGEPIEDYMRRCEATAATHGLTPEGHPAPLNHKPWSIERSPDGHGQYIGIRRLGKAHTGRLLDGVEHKAFPKTV